jgi:hypothetical protein
MRKRHIQLTPGRVCSVSELCLHPKVPSVSILVLCVVRVYGCPSKRHEQPCDTTLVLLFYPFFTRIFVRKYRLPPFSLVLSSQLWYILDTVLSL